MNHKPVAWSLGMRRRSFCFLFSSQSVSTGDDVAMSSQRLSFRGEARQEALVFFLSTCEHPLAEAAMGMCTFVCIHRYKEEQMNSLSFQAPH